MEQRSNKTIMCSVFFLDIVEYSKKSVSGQIALKDGFNALLALAIQDTPLNDRIILDTGDGAAISFLGDVEDALKSALIVREHLLSEAMQTTPPLLVRMGINLGPVRLVRDINGQPNIVGDGINVAQRVMGFAEQGQILVSRSYYDAVSRLSADYANMFHYQGARTDKHVREHEVYAIGYPTDATSEMAVQAAPLAQSAAPLPRKNLMPRWYALGGLALLLVLAIGIKLLSHKEAPPVVVLKPSDSVQMPIQVVSAVSENSHPNLPVIESSVPPAVMASNKKNSNLDSKPESIKTDKANKKIARTRTVGETPPVLHAAPGLVTIAVAPWGEVYLDGRMQGVSPPLAELQVLPGRHEIEIRNTTFPAYSQNIAVGTGETVKIKHKFIN